MQTTTSPDGNLRVEFSAVEMRMSHTVESPVITHIPTGETIVDLGGTLWDCFSLKFGYGGEIILDLRKYPGDKPSVRAIIFTDTRTFKIGEGEDSRTENLSKINQFLDRIYA